MSRLRLEQEQQVAVSLCLLVIWKDTFLYIGRVFQVACYLVLLQTVSRCDSSRAIILLTSSSAIRFWIRRAILESKYRTSFSSTKFFFDCDEILDLRSRRIFWAVHQENQQLSHAQGDTDCTNLWPVHLLSPSRSPVLTWTCTGQTWSTAWTGERSWSHCTKTWCSGGRGVVGRTRPRT